MEAYRKAGINRLSIGLQSADDQELHTLGRIHTWQDFRNTYEAARKAGFANINIDLMSAIPGQTLKSYEKTLERVCSLCPEHISAYHLTIEPGTAFGRRAERGTFAPVDEEVSEAEFTLVHETLTRAGFEHYEVSNFARPGCRARHNAAYWNGSKYLGIGPAAHSFDGRERHWNVASVERYINGEAPETETLSDRDRFNEYVMTRLRTAEGIDLRDAEARFGSERTDRLKKLASAWLQSGTVAFSDRRLNIPAPKMLLSDAVIEALFET